MPLYDYDCAACGRRFEVIHGVHADGPATCPLCGKGPVRKAFAPPAIHFKGSGWAKKERRAAGTKSSSGKSDGAEKRDGGETAAAGSTTESGEGSKATSTKDSGSDASASTTKGD
jgi:putative FmdB family regulatory protein